MKFLKTIRFDPSDMHVFELAAEPDEWAISGSFWFTSVAKTEFKGKLKQAFSNGFLSLESFGFSTFSSVSFIDEKEVDRITDLLARKLVSDFNAPSHEAAETAARQEVNDVITMCSEVPINSVFAIRRELDDCDNISERLSLVTIENNKVHTKIWEIVE